MRHVRRTIQLKDRARASARAMRGATMAFALMLTAGVGIARAELTPEQWASEQQQVLSDASTPRLLVVALCRDATGNLWLACEDQGVWQFDGEKHAWVNWQQKAGLAEAHATAIACDAHGRIWVGHRAGGLSVYDGRAWKSYSLAQHVAVTHVYALAAGSQDDMWAATSDGLARYRDKTGTWEYRTRLNGLPAGTVTCLAVALDGTLYAGTDCSGLAVANAADDYAGFRLVGRGDPGKGLPSDQINAVATASDGTVYVATPSGLAWAKTGAMATGFAWMLAIPSEPLRSDQVMTLACGERPGEVMVGYRTGEADRLQLGATHTAEAMLRIKATGEAPEGGPVTAIDPSSGLVVRYRVPVDENPAPSAPRQETPAHLPGEGKSVTVEESHRLIQKLKGLNEKAVSFVGEDWVTQGDWEGRYGESLNQQPTFENGGRDGPRFFLDVAAAGQPSPGEWSRADGVWIGLESEAVEGKCTDPRAAYSKLHHSRIMAQWVDHTREMQRASITGRGLYVVVKAPSKCLASFYFVNRDGHAKGSCRRDMLVTVREASGPDNNGVPTRPTVDDFESADILAQCRVRGFYPGVWKTFLIDGGKTYTVAIERNSGPDAVCSGVFLDLVNGPEPNPRKRLFLKHSGGRTDFIDPATLDTSHLGAATAGWREAVDSLKKHPEWRGVEAERIYLSAIEDLRKGVKTVAAIGDPLAADQVELKYQMDLRQSLADCCRGLRRPNEAAAWLAEVDRLWPVRK